MNDKDVLKQKVFISQPMNDITDDDIKRLRAKLERFFNDNNLDVIDSYLEDDDRTPVEMLGKSIELMGKADFVYFAKDWKNSRGCQIEFNVAKSYGIPYSDNLEDFVFRRFI